jgi:hypothetical protein
MPSLCGACKRDATEAARQAAKEHIRAHGLPRPEQEAPGAPVAEEAPAAESAPVAEAALAEAPTTPQAPAPEAPPPEPQPEPTPSEGA